MTLKEARRFKVITGGEMNASQEEYRMQNQIRALKDFREGHFGC
jgi:hypothetical protein